MQKDLYKTDHYLDHIPTGMQVFWYPGGRKDVSTNPRVGFVQLGHTRGVADISILPTQDGAVEHVVHVPHIGDPKVFDHQGNLSRMAKENGCWEFTPTSLMIMEWQGATTAKPKKTAKATS